MYKYKKKETAIKHLRAGSLFEHPVFDLFRDDKEVVLEAVKQDGGALKYASKNIRELCKGKNPIETLEIEIQKEKLQNTIIHPEHKQPLQTPPTKRRMI